MHKQKLLACIAVCMLYIIFTQAVFGQSNFMQNVGGGNSFASDVNGQPMYLKTEYIADGSPYLYEEYCLAEVTTMNGKVYPDVKIKINLLERLILYTTDTGAEMIALTPVKRIRFYSLITDGGVHDEITLQSYNSAINSPEAPIYAVLEDSSVKLFKQISVTYTDTKRYGEATITRVFKKDETYYALLPGKEQQLKKIERNKTSVTALFEPKQSIILSYIEKQKLKCKTEQDLIKVFRYYNSISSPNY